MNEILSPGRQTGKTILMREQLEKLLDSGKRVLVIQNGAMVSMRKKKHLTLIETIPRNTTWKSLDWPFK